MRTTDSLTKFVGNLTGYRSGPMSFNASYYTGLYDSGGWLYRAAVDRIALDCFRRGYKWVADQDDISAIDQLERKHNIVDKKRRALQLARLDGEGFIYFDDGGPTTGEFIIERAKDLRFANVLRSSEVAPQDNETNPLSPLYGTPRMYAVNGVSVHPSRLCRVVTNRDPANGRGVPVLKIVDDIIQKAVCTRNHIVDLVGEARIDVIKTKGLMDAMEDDYARDAMQRKVELVAQMKSNLAILLMDMEGEDYQQKSSSFATLPDVLESIRREVSAALEIPHAVLFGRDGGLGTNGEMDLVVYHETVASMQRNDVEPAFSPLDQLVIKTATKKVPDGSIYLEWLPMKQPTDKEMQEIGDKIATRHKTLIDAGFAREVLEGPTVNALIEAGVAPGLEESWNDWLAGGGDYDNDETGDIADDDEVDPNGAM